MPVHHSGKPQNADAGGSPDAFPPPTNEDVRRKLDRLQSKNPDFIRIRTVLSTSQGRPIEAATLTDPDVPDIDKQHVLIVAGQHGNEESARLVALGVMDYLLSSDGKPLLKRQKFVVLPNLSPDAAAQDSYETPQGIKPNLDHAPTGPVSNEAKALEIVANELQPELYVDIHARGLAGCSHDMVLFPPSRPYTEDEMLLHATAREMALHGERSGIPHLVHPLTWPGWGGYDLDQPSSTLWMYRQFKSMVFLTENSEHNEHSYPEKTRLRSGVARLKPLLAMGNRRYPSLYYSGYPCAMAVGMFNAGIVAVGADAAARRKSRVQIWKNESQFEKVAPVIPERDGLKVMRIDYQGQPLTAGAGVQVRVAGKVLLKSVTFNGRKLKSAESDGFYTWHDKHTTFAVASVSQLTPGEHEVVFTFQ